jgi:hypothetical protein
MGPISVIAEAGQDIIRRIASGELEVHGIQLRDASKKIRYVLRGFENLPLEAGRLSNLPPLESLHAAMNATQILQVITIAQNAAIAVSLRRIEARLDSIESRLGGIETRLKRVDTKQNLVLEALRTAPVSRLKAAKTAAVVALQHGDRTALIAAGKDVQQASHDLLDQARHLVRVEEDGLPIAILLPVELADLAESAAEAASAASAIWLALDNQAAAAGIMRETADSLESMRRKLASTLIDPELMLRRIKVDEGQDAKLLAAGARLREAMLWSSGRAVMIEQGLILADPARVEFERAIPADGIAFVPVIDTQADAVLVERS